MAKKSTRKELLKTDDAFIAAASRGAEWLRANRKGVIAGSVAFVVVVGSAWAALEYQRNRNRQAALQYNEALALLQAPIEGEPTASPGQDADADLPTFASAEEKHETARDAFRDVLADYEGTGAARLAKFYVADLNARLGERKAAAAVLTELVETLSADDHLYFLAVERLAYLREAAGELDAAAAAWKRLEQGFYADRSLYQQARLALAQGQRERAAELLDTLQKDHPDSAIQDKADRLLAQTSDAQPTAAAVATGKGKHAGASTDNGPGSIAESGADEATRKAENEQSANPPSGQGD